MFKRKILAALVATTTVGFTGYAMNASATDLSATANVTILAPIAIVEDTQLNFGSVAPDTTSGVTVTVAPGGGISSASTPTAGLGGGHAAGSFTVTGITAAAYAVTLPSVDIIFNGMTLNGFTSASSGGFVLGGGTDTLTVGATLAIPAGQVAGPYSTPYTVTVNYN